MSTYRPILNPDGTATDEQLATIRRDLDGKLIRLLSLLGGRTLEKGIFDNVERYRTLFGGGRTNRSARVVITLDGGLTTARWLDAIIVEVYDAHL